nr:acetoacetate--CoA ligase [Williamsia sp. CHRR-6]
MNNDVDRRAETDARRLAAFTDFAASLPDGVGPDYDSVWRWSVDDPAAFWRAVWEHSGIRNRAATPLGDADTDVLASRDMPGTRWFRGVELNYVDLILDHAAHHGDRDPQRPAIIAVDETGTRTVITWGELPGRVGATAAALRAAGVSAGDVVVAYLPDVADAVTAFLATASLGALWSACGADYAPDGAAARLGQLDPTVLVVANGYRFNGSWVDKRGDATELAAAIDSVSTVITIAEPGGPDFSGDLAGRTVLAMADIVATPVAPEPVAVAFDHPLWVMFSSGTTGKPKGIVHGHGGVTLELVKSMTLHAGLGRADRFFWHTALSWMMWNYRTSGLLCGATIVSYSGHPLHPSADRLWEIVESERVTYFGTSPGHLQASRKAGLTPGATRDLAALTTVGSTGSTLVPDLFEWVTDHVGVTVSSISGGTDVSTAFAGGSVGVPVVPGELSVRYLGVDLHSWSPQGRDLVGEVGEMVITTPMPSMPVSFWRDGDGTRYRSAYFDHEWTGRGVVPNVWRHGDWVTLTDRGSVIIHGRSDATLNRNGIRMGSADIYEVVEAIDEIAEAFVVGVDGPDGAYWMPLFVTLVPAAAARHDDATLDPDLVSRIRTDIRARLSPRHVPDEVILAPGIPHTRTGKKLEVPITGILAGRTDVSLDPRSVDDASLIDWYAARGADHSW